MSEPKVTKPRHLGPSRDWRTSRWEITCPACGKLLYPDTTTHARQWIECDKCGEASLANYNEGTVTLRGPA